MGHSNGARQDGSPVKGRWSIRNRFILFSFLCLIPVAVLTFYLLDEIDTKSNEEIVSNEAAMSSLVSNTLSSYLSTNFRAVENLSNISAVIQQDDPETINAVLGQARTFRPDQAGLFVINADGDIVGQSGTDAALIAPEIQSQVTTTLTTGQRTVTQRIDLDLEEPTSVIVLLVPITTLTETESTAPRPTETPASIDIRRRDAPDPDANAYP